MTAITHQFVGPYSTYHLDAAVANMQLSCAKSHLSSAFDEIKRLNARLEAQRDETADAQSEVVALKDKLEVAHETQHLINGVQKVEFFPVVSICTEDGYTQLITVSIVEDCGDGGETNGYSPVYERRHEVTRQGDPSDPDTVAFITAEAVAGFLTSI